MSEARAKDIEAAVTHVQQAMELVERLHRTPHEGVTTNGIVEVLSGVVRRIEALGDDDGE